MESVDVSKYKHSPVHSAVVSRDYAGLRRILFELPKFRDLSEVQTEAISIAEEAKADAISAVIDRRDVPNRETPLNLAVKLRDTTAAEMLMAAGADWTLQNEQGWNALQEAICSRQESIAITIVRCYQPYAWAKWCRRLPRLIATMGRMRDFYMEISFHFESSVVPFVSKIAPSDTYKIWKAGANLRADMTLSGFDGLKIQRSDQSVLFLGDGSEDGRIRAGSLCLVSHKEKEVMNALGGSSVPASEEEVRKEVAAMFKSNLFRPGIDVTEAVLLPQMSWRRQEKVETVGPWKAKVYDMHNVVFSVKSRRIPGVKIDDESGNESETEGDELGDGDVLTEEEKRQLEAAFKLDLPDCLNESGDNGHRRGYQEQMEVSAEDFDEIRIGSDRKQERKGWFSGWRKKEALQATQTKNVPPRSSLCVDEKVSDLLGDSNRIKPGRHSAEAVVRDENRKTIRVSMKTTKEVNRENEYKKGLRPVLWLSPSFPLRTEELLPLFDILASKVKAIRRLRDLLTTKLPVDTFPVKVAIPVVPTIRVIVTFTKFEELKPEDEFKTPPSSPSTAAGGDSPVTTHAANSSSWFNWSKPPNDGSVSNGKGSNVIQTLRSPFAIPSDYTWVTAEAKMKKMQQKNKHKKGKRQNQ